MNQLPPLVLIVDVENIRPPAALEQSVANAFSGINMLKIAVGNWKLLNCDRELQARGYHLVHVAQGKDAADLEICHLTDLLGHGTKVVVVSNDKIFLNLAVKLGEVTDTSIYIVKRNENKYFLSEWMLLLDEPEIDSRIIKFTSEPEFITALEQLLEPGDILSAKALADKFREVYEISVREIIKSFGINENFSNFLSSRGIMSDSLLAQAFIAPVSLNLAKTISSTLEKSELIKKVRGLIVENPTLTNDMREFGQQWRQINGIGLREHMQQVGIPGTPGSLIAQIQSNSNFELN
jgi:hypothetical protein